MRGDAGNGMGWRKGCGELHGGRERCRTVAVEADSGEELLQPGGTRERGKLGEWKRRSGRFYRSH